MIIFFITNFLIIANTCLRKHHFLIIQLLLVCVDQLVAKLKAVYDKFDTTKDGLSGELVESALLYMSRSLEAPQVRRWWWCTCVIVVRVVLVVLLMVVLVVVMLLLLQLLTSTMVIIFVTIAIVVLVDIIKIASIVTMLLLFSLVLFFLLLSVLRYFNMIAKLHFSLPPLFLNAYFTIVLSFQ